MTAIDLTAGLREQLRAVISDAYYDARNSGETMTFAAGDAADRVMDRLSRAGLPSVKPAARLDVQDLGRQTRQRYLVSVVAGNGEEICRYGNLYGDRRDVRRAVILTVDAGLDWLEQNPGIDEVVHVNQDDPQVPAALGGGA